MNEFHDITRTWFQERFTSPTVAQVQGWESIRQHRHTLIAAPTGSGKTLAAFLVCIDRLVREAIDCRLEEKLQVLYVSPLRALSNDVRKNLSQPLEEITRLGERKGHLFPTIRAMVRTGDTPPSERQAMVKKPPHILVTTPESLFLLLTGSKSRNILRSVHTLIVDEIHALARDKRGSHLSLSIERLQSIVNKPFVRIGLSATQKPIQKVAQFLVGGKDPCQIVNQGHLRKLDLAIEVPKSPLSAVCSNENWDEMYARMSELIEMHRSTLIFVNTRRMAERISHQLRERLGEQAVASHHGSLAKEIRQSAEARLKAGELKAIVATASLELGIDVGYIELVCQIGSPRAIATFLQRIGRSGHFLGGVPKGRLFALTRDELIESSAVIRAIKANRLDAIEIPRAPIDILAQQIVAEVANEEWDEEALYNLVRQSFSYRDLKREDFESTLRLLSEGIDNKNRKITFIHRDQVNQKVKAKRWARITALTSGGAIPEQADYRVINEADGSFVGTVNEDFAIESMKGDIFLLGNTSWQILWVRGGEVLVRDAQGAPATIPFWLGEAPGRTVELSEEVSQLRESVADRLPEDIDGAIGTGVESGLESNTQSPPAYQSAIAFLQAQCNLTAWQALQLVHYVAAQKAAIGFVATQKKILFERFFDESGGMQLVIHSPYGMRINRAWGLALRKSFCRRFDFELQASADDNGIVLSLGPNQSFPLESLFKILKKDRATAVLIQALLATPIFQVRWRWNVTRALFVLRFQKGKKVPPPLQRFKADDLLTEVFPAQTACQENVVGDIPIPDHPLIGQTVHDGLNEAMDIDGFLALLDKIERGELELVARESREPSPFSYELLNANPYAFLDDAPLEERRARAVATRRSLDIGALKDLGKLDNQVISQISQQALPIVRDPDELHEALMMMYVLPQSGIVSWERWYETLVSENRAFQVELESGQVFWVAAERVPWIEAVYPDAKITPKQVLPKHLAKSVERSSALVELVRGQLRCSGPVSESDLCEKLGIASQSLRSALEALEGEGFVIRGKFTQTQVLEWCERGLLARIHRGTLQNLRKKIQPVSREVFLRYLMDRQHLSKSFRLEGRQGHLQLMDQLQGFESSLGSWEEEIIASRMEDYNPDFLDYASQTGQLVWGRLNCRTSKKDGESGFRTLTRVTPVGWAKRGSLGWILPVDREVPTPSRSQATQVLNVLIERGAQFFDDLRTQTRLLPSELYDALGELLALGWISCDGFQAVRPLIRLDKSTGWGRRHASRNRHKPTAFSNAGRWFLLGTSTLREPEANNTENKLEDREFREQRIAFWVRQLLSRYGVIFKDLLSRETLAPYWGELLFYLRKLEAEGEIRGGRFISGVAGEQFALPEAVQQLRRKREESPTGEWILVSAADPVNLVGILTPGNRITAKSKNALLWVDGVLIAACEGGEVTFYQQWNAEKRQRAEKILKGSRKFWSDPSFAQSLDRASLSQNPVVARR